MKSVSYYRANIYVIKNPINGYQSISNNTDFIFNYNKTKFISMFSYIMIKKYYTNYKDLIIIVIRIHI